MSNPIELWKKWEGKDVGGKFALRQWLGGSDHSAVFLTERGGQDPRKAAIKLLGAENLDENDQLSRWAEAAKLAHPHLIRLFEYGRCQIDDTRLVYVVMEYAEENLSEIIPLRQLSASEATEMLPPVVDAMSFLHQTGYVHGHVRPSNIMAVDNQLKISADGLCAAGQFRGKRVPSAYDAPETATQGPSPAGDIWSLGATLAAVLTQKEPRFGEKNVLPGGIPERLRKILQECLHPNPQQRCTLNEILQELQTQASEEAETLAQAQTRQNRTTRWMAALVVVAVLFFIGLVGSKFISRGRPTPVVENHSAPVSSPPSSPPAPSPASFSQKAAPPPKSNAPGSVLTQVMPDVSRNALNTITGRVRVGVQVAVDASGNVSDAQLVSAGPSKYFASRALSAARRWKFAPPTEHGRPAASAWLLRFQFSNTSAQVFPAETRP